MKTKRFKIFYIILIFIYCFSLPLFAQEDEYNIEKIIDFLAFGTGSTTGTYYPLGNAFAHIWTQKSKKINVMTHSTNGSYENIELLRSHEINLAIAQSDIVKEAIEGKGKFINRPYKDLRILAGLYPEVIQIIVASESTKINSINDLKGYRINVGPANSGNALTAIELLNTLGIRENDYKKVFMSYDEVIQAMEKKECDATIIIAGVPTKAVIELKKRLPIKIINIDFKTTKDIASKLTYLTEYTLTNETYGIGDRVNTLAVMSLLISNKELKDDLAYDLIKMIFDNIEYLKIIHERAKDISLENAEKGIIKEYFHPGAIKYFKEIKSK